MRTKLIYVFCHFIPRYLGKHTHNVIIHTLVVPKAHMVIYFKRNFGIFQHFPLPEFFLTVCQPYTTINQVQIIVLIYYCVNSHATNSETGLHVISVRISYSQMTRYLGQTTNREPFRHYYSHRARVLH